MNEGGGDRLAALWLETFQTLGDRVAHDIRNVLNAVAVNLEVVRGRSARGGEGAPLAPFAAAAATQFEILAGKVDALLAVLRTPPAEGDISVLLGRLVTLLGTTRRDDAPIRIDTPLAAPGGTSSAPFTGVRLALTAALLAARTRPAGVACRVGTDSGPTVYIECDSGGPISLADDVAAALTEAGISLTPSAHGITIAFPPTQKG